MLSSSISMHIHFFFLSFILFANYSLVEGGKGGEGSRGCVCHS